MKRMKMAGLTVVASALAGQAFAADLPSRKAPPIIPYMSPVSIYNWSGIYWGSQLGYSSLTVDQSETDFWPALNSYQGGPRTNYATSGLMIGSHLGYQQQFSSVVAGLEADFDGPFIRGRRAYQTPWATTGWQATEVANTLRGSLRGRLGFAFDRALPYITGGLAVGGFRQTVTSGFGATDSRNFTRLGWTIGAGIDYSLTPEWSLRAEYRYSDYGRYGFTTTQAMAGNIFSTRLTDHSARIGFSYHWRGWGGGPVAARY